MDSMLNVGEILLRAFVSIIVLFLLAKLMGKKQISQLTFFDYVVGISIGSIAAVMATDDDIPFHVPLIAMAVYALIAFFLSILTNKSVGLRHLVNGTPILLMENGKLLRKNFSRARIELNEFLCECRVLGFFDLSEIQSAVMETNGRISILPMADKRPVQPSDMQLTPPADEIPANVILDGKIMPENLKQVGKDEAWLNNQLKLQKVGSCADVFLGTCDKQGTLSLYFMDNKPRKHSPFE